MAPCGMIRAVSSIQKGGDNGTPGTSDYHTRTRPDFNGTSAAEGVAVDPQGNIYGAEVGPKRVMKYTMKTRTSSSKEN